ncbi:MAG: DUF2225 domain-containing protein [Firmicutes bacterium]|nr:DUF2225 domain-containing protein [Bacillota bacterium]
MPQVFWVTCPFCGTKFTAEKVIWDRDDPLLCPQCLEHFKRADSPAIETVWPVTFQDLRTFSRRAD